MIRNKYVATALLALTISVLGVMVRNHSGERYYSCTGHQKKSKTIDGNNLALSSYVSLSLEAGGNGKVQLQGYIFKNGESHKLDRLLDFRFTPQKNKTLYLFETDKVTRLPDDNVNDKDFDEISDFNSGHAFFGVKRNGPHALVLGDTLQPRLVCISRL